MLTAGVAAPRISVVVIALNEGEYLRPTLTNLTATLPPDSEILVVDDGSEDGSTSFLESGNEAIRLVRSDRLGVAKARNWGASQTSGDVIVFADAHITLPEKWWEPLVEVLENPEVGAVAPAIYDTADPGKKGFGLHLSNPELQAEWSARHGHEPHPAAILPGCCLAMRRETFNATGGFDGGLLSRGGVDNALSVRFWLLRYELIIVPDLAVGHVFRKSAPYPVKWSTHLHNGLRLAFLHLSEARVFKVIEAMKKHGSFA